MEAVKAKEASEEITAKFLASLPAELTEHEETLRGFLLDSVLETGSVQLSMVAQKDDFREAKNKLGMPKAALSKWIEQRVPDDIMLMECPKTGSRLLVAPYMADKIGTPAPRVSLEDFFAALPEDEFTAEEEALRLVVLDVLGQSGGRARMDSLTRPGRTVLLGRELTKARQALLPLGIGLAAWLERRMGAEATMSTEKSGAKVVELKAYRPKWQAQQAAKEWTPRVAMPTPKAKSQAVLPGWRSAALPSQAEDFATFTSEKKDHTNEAAGGLTEEERLAIREEREARVADFFLSLPADELSREEQEFREALFSELRAFRGQRDGRGHVRLSLLCQKPRVNAAKKALLPDGVTVNTWIEQRIGGELLVDRVDEQITVGFADDDSKASEPSAPSKEARGWNARLAATRVAPPETEEDWEAAKLEHEAKLEAFFRGPWLPVERKLRDALMQACGYAAAPLRLGSLANEDKEISRIWATAKEQWKGMGLAPTLSRWVEARLQEDIRVTREPYISLAKPAAAKFQRAAAQVTVGAKRWVGDTKATEQPWKRQAVGAVGSVVGSSGSKPYWSPKTW